jgi:T-complex protein 1 subunit theta
VGWSFRGSHLVIHCEARSNVGVIKKASKAKVGVFSCPIDISQTETKGTVLLHNATEMLEFSKGEEVQLEKVPPMSA